MFEGIARFFRKIGKKEKEEISSRETAKERLHLVLMQDRANVSADFLDMMKQEIIEVIKKYIDIDEKEIDVKLTNKVNEDGTTGAPALYANIPIANIKQDVAINKKDSTVEEEVLNKEEQNVEETDKKEDGEEIVETEIEDSEIIEEAQEIIDNNAESEEDNKDAEVLVEEEVIENEPEVQEDNKESENSKEDIEEDKEKEVEEEIAKTTEN